MKKVSKFLINALPVLIAILGSVYVLFGGKTPIEIPLDADFHFNLITVNALFGGFLYTNYSLLIGLSDNHIVEKIKTTNIIKKRNMHILKGIIFATVSVVAGLFFVVIPESDSKIQKVLSTFVANFEITFMIFLIFYFILSLCEMKNLIDNINYSPKRKSSEEIKNLEEKIKSQIAIAS